MVATDHLDALRYEVDALDHTLLVHVAQRLALVRRIAREKKTLGRPVVDLEREEVVRGRMIEEGERLDIPTPFAVRLVDLLLEEGRATVAAVYAEDWVHGEGDA